MGQRHLLDTNTVIDYVGNKLPNLSALALDSILEGNLNISIIVKIETLGFNGPDDQMQKLKGFLSLATIFYVDEAIADKTIELRKVYQKLKLGDAIIAATALINNLIIITRNISDFKNIEGLRYLNPHEIK